MLSFLISAVGGFAIGFVVYRDHGTIWGTISAMIMFLLIQLVVGLIIRKFVNREQMIVQNILLQAQNDINRQLTIFQRRSPGSERTARQILEKIQVKATRDALAATDGFQKYYIWNFMLKRQINTMKMQLYFQLQDYKMVDELLPQCMLFDQQSLAIKLVRLYKKEDPQLAKFYQKKCARLKGESCAFVASVYAWILLKQNNVQAAVDVLLAAKNKTDHPVVVENFDRLANGKVKQFSNAGFGDMWFALGLEEMKVKSPKQKMPRPF